MKNLLSLFPLVLLVAFSFIVTSCNKDSADYGPQAPNPQKLSVSANPYDYVGEEHNRGLDFFVENADFGQYHSQVTPLVLEFGRNAGYQRSDVEAALNSPEIAAIINGADTYTTVREYLITNDKLLQLQYVDKIQAAFAGSPQTAAPVIEKLLEVEDAVLHDVDLTATEQAALLRGVAVGKYSAQYWYEQSKLGVDSPWTIKMAEAGSSEPQARWWQWLIVAGADAIGATAGFPSGPVGGIATSLVAFGLVFG